MVFNANEFRASKPMIIEYYNTKGLDYIAFVCSVSWVPIIAAYVFIKEENPDNEEVGRRIEAALAFYDYTELIGAEYEK